jgi:fructan beta-fructosidase
MSSVRLPLLSCGLVISFLFAAAQVRPYSERYRPQVHFSPREHWTNDPNGLVYFHGEYHLFFQFNPLGDQWGHMSWGHAISHDLMHWRELPVAIPEKDGEMVFTGSVVVDRHNTSGFCRQHQACLVAIYTGHRVTPIETRQTQNIAYSLDDGRTWTRYAQNPVLDLHMADFRDPSVSWDEKERRWTMAVSLPRERKVLFYASPNLKDWTQLSEFGPAGDVDGDWECPDLLKIPGEHGAAELWALKIGLNPGAPQGGSGEQYFLGQFDGKRFIPTTQRGSHGWTNYGKDDYCAISFNGLPAYEKPVLLGWMSNWQYATKLPTSPWRGQMSLPRRLSLLRDSAGLALRQEPIVERLRTQRQIISGGKKMTHRYFRDAPFELDLTFVPANEREFGVRLYTGDRQWTDVGFDRTRREFYMDRTHSGAEVSPEFPGRTVAPSVETRSFDLKLIVDWSSIEAYAQNGTIAMTNLAFPVSTRNRIKIFSVHEGGTRVENSGMHGDADIQVTGEIWNLQSIWK